MNNIEITVKINGKNVPLHTLSEKTLLELRKETVPLLKHGDEVVCPSGRYYIAMEQSPKSDEVNIWGDGYINGFVKKTSTYYKYTGFNVFADMRERHECK